MWKPLITKRSTSAANKLRAAQMSVTLVPRAKEASMAGRTGLPKSVLGLAAGVVLLAALGFSVSAASSQNQAPRGTKAFHATKDCSGFTGLAGAFCTIRSSNVKALKVGSKIFYFQAGGKTALDSDIGHLRGARHRRNRPLPPSFRDRGRTVHDLGRHGNARRVPGPRACHGRFVDPEAVALGRDLQLQSGLDPVGNRPVSERVARWLSSLSAKYIAVFALLVAVPVICTSVYLLYSSYQDNKRALTRLQQEKAKSVAVTIDQYFMDLTSEDEVRCAPSYLSFTALGSVLQPLLEDNATDCVLRRQRPGARRSQPRAAGSPRSRGTSSTIARWSRRGRRGSTSARVRATAPVQPRSTIDGGHGSRRSDRGHSRTQEPESSARHSISESFRTSSGRRGSGRPDTSTRSTPRACPSRTRTPPLSRIVPWLFLR